MCIPDITDPNSLRARILCKVQVDPKSGCWLWQGGKKRRGHGTISVAGKTCITHRVAYVVFRGRIPAGCHLDHEACDTPSCVNPWHLRPVRSRTNTLRGRGPTAQNARKRVCPQGHRYTPSNTYRPPGGGRKCRTCRREESRRRRAP